MSKQEARQVAHLQLDSADHFVQYTRIGNKLHTAGDMNLNDIALCFLQQCHALGLSKSILSEQLKIAIDQVYDHPPQQSPVIPLN